jgi:sugar/nucleoside kinase (ribokinase family)
MDRHELRDTGPVQLLCVGNAIVDIFAGLDSTFTDRMGLGEKVQHISPAQAQRILAELKNFSRSSGGGAANAAKIAALLNVSAAFMGCTGDDEPAAFFENELRSAGVIPILKRVKAPTGTCFILNNGDEARIATSPAAALELTKKDVSEEVIRNAGLIVLDGYIHERRPLVKKNLNPAGRRGIPIALDAASEFTAGYYAKKILRYCRKYPLILFMNADECIAFYQSLTKGKAGNKLRSEQEKEEMILREICPMLKNIAGSQAGDFPVIVIKLGGRGALAAAGGSVYREETITLNPRGTTGAGDAFCAAFLSAWIRKKPIPECLALGNTVAGKILAGLPIVEPLCSTQ